MQNPFNHTMLNKLTGVEFLPKGKSSNALCVHINLYCPRPLVKTMHF